MIKKIASRIVYENKWMKVREDNTELEDGSKGIYGVVEKPDFALIIPLIDNHVFLVHQYRYPAEASFWEFPQGSHQENPDIDPTKLALEELKEETGLVAKKIKKIGHLYTAYGMTNQGFHIFLAQELEQGKQQLETTEQGLKVEKFSMSDFEKMIQKGEIKDGPTVSAYGLLKIQGIV
ncbi:MAG: NUDIX hydrolase [Candidatus Andersenbacteria bacterium]|nr:NUDIX hydrolase [Candidatus Andersenbacteria bacterium]